MADGLASVPRFLREQLKDGDKDIWEGGTWLGLWWWRYQIAYTAEEVLNNQVAVLVDVIQPLFSSAQCLYNGLMNRAAMMAEMKAYAWAQEHTHLQGLV